MQHQQVDLVDTELARALLKAVQRLVVAVVADPDLRLQEHLRAVKPGVAHRFSDLPLVAVGSRRVDMPVAASQCGLDCGSGLLRKGLEHSQTKSWHLDFVVQRGKLHPPTLRPADHMREALSLPRTSSPPTELGPQRAPDASSGQRASDAASCPGIARWAAADARLAAPGWRDDEPGQISGAVLAWDGAGAPGGAAKARARRGERRTRRRAAAPLDQVRLNSATDQVRSSRHHIPRSGPQV